jgi:hypothetical protein
LISQGIDRVAAASGNPVPYSILLNESDAIESALDRAPDNALVVIFPDNVSQAIALIMARNPLPDSPIAAKSADLPGFGHNGNVVPNPQTEATVPSNGSETQAGYSIGDDAELEQLVEIV